MTLWAIFLALFLILYGLLTISNITFALSGVLLGVLAIGAGVLLFLGK